jgi:hypothetical protein
MELLGEQRFEDMFDRYFRAIDTYLNLVQYDQLEAYPAEADAYNFLIQYAISVQSMNILNGKLLVNESAKRLENLLSNVVGWQNSGPQITANRERLDQVFYIAVPHLNPTCYTLEQHDLLKGLHPIPNQYLPGMPVEIYVEGMMRMFRSCWRAYSFMLLVASNELRQISKIPLRQKDAGYYAEFVLAFNNFCKLADVKVCEIKSSTA